MRSPSRKVFLNSHGILAVIHLLLVSAVVSAQAKTYTYPDLVRTLTDLSLLAEQPATGETTALASSYDRHSKYDPITDKYIDWDADADGNGFIRKEGDKTVLAEIRGPGCIFRVWTATASEGHVKIFLDGNEIPAVDLPFSGYFDGKNEPFTQPALVYKTTGGNTGYDNYTPIPFQKSCKIVADPGWGRYFQFTYRQFAPDTLVPTFTRHLSPEDSAALVEANKILDRSDRKLPPQSKQSTETVNLTVPAGKSSVVFDRTGAEAITGLRVKFELPNDIEAQRILLRQLALRMVWDGQNAPSVWAPWGDFFGDSAGAFPFHSFTTGLGTDGYWYCNWYMPFASRATLSVDNDSPSPVIMSWEITHAPLRQPAESLLRFHAKWHRNAFLPQRKDRQIDWTLLTTLGRGRFIGTQFHVWNPRGGWWGEGDDKFFVDGEKFPSSFGTGFEDYFGAAWGLGSVFNKAFHGLNTNESLKKGHTSVHRWHISDNVPFQTSFEGAIEKYYKDGSPFFTKFDAVAFWYLDPQGNDPYPPVPVSERINGCDDPPVYHEADVIEAEKLTVSQQQPDESVDRLDAVLLLIPPGRVSGDKLVRWQAREIGQRMSMEFQVKKAGKYRVLARFLHKDDGGIFQLQTNDQKLGSPVDLYGPPEEGQFEASRNSGGAISYATAVDPVDLGICDLAAGENTFSAVCVGENESISRRDGHEKAFFLDYIKLIPLP